MPDTNLYRKEHCEILHIIEEIVPFLDFNHVSEDSNAVHSLFVKLSKTLYPHMSVEKKQIYPYLYIHKDNDVRIPAIRFYYKHKEIMRDIKKYQLKWAKPDSIQKNPFEFIKDCNLFFEAIRQRIIKENSELFPLVER